MKSSSIRFAAAAAAALSLSLPVAEAATWTIPNTSVTAVMVHADSTFGGCMAKLAVDPKTVAPLCGAWWVTFSCSGNFTTMPRAYRMLDQAQLALSTAKRVTVVIRDHQQHNGICMVQRIDVLN